MLDREGGKVGGRALWINALSAGGVAGIVGDSGIPDVYGDALRGHAAAPAGLPDAKDHIGTQFLCLGQNSFGGSLKNSGDL